LYPNMRVADFPVNLTHLCRSTKGQFGTPQQILNNMTLVRFFKKLGSYPWRTGSLHYPIEDAGYGLATISNGNIAKWRACPYCIEADLKNSATSFGRRSHHLPTSFFCTIHNSPLVACQFLSHDCHNHFFLPEQAIIDTKFRQVSWNTNFDLLKRLTRLSVDVLEGCEEPLSSQTAYATFINALEAQDLLTRSKAIRKERFISEFTNRYGFLASHSDFHKALTPQGINILIRNLSYSDSIQSAVHTLLLIDWLFGTWHSFVVHCEWQNIMDCHEYDISKEIYQRKKSLQSSVNETKSDEQQEHRRTCLDFLNMNSQASRSRFARKAPKSFRWLLRYDAEWFNINCPTDRFKKTQESLF
jgi:hypothetical protein